MPVCGEKQDIEIARQHQQQENQLKVEIGFQEHKKLWDDGAASDAHDE